MSEVKLTPTQHSLLLALSHKQMTITAVQAAMGGVSKELAESLLRQLSQLHLITKYTNGQYRANAAGARYLKHNEKAKAVDAIPVAEAELAEASPAEPEVIAAVPAEAVVIAPVAELVMEIPKPELTNIDESLIELERRLSLKLHSPQQMDLKLQVLNRLSLLLDPSIGAVLNNIATDLVQMQEAA